MVFDPAVVLGLSGGLGMGPMSENPRLSTPKKGQKSISVKKRYIFLELATLNFSYLQFPRHSYPFEETCRDYVHDPTQKSCAQEPRLSK